MRIALITDNHAGARNNSPVFIDIQKRFFTDCFFPELERREIKQILHLGDFFESRKSINLLAMYEAKQMFLDRLKNYDMKIILGNHDTHHKNSNEINSLEMFLKPYCHVITAPTELTFDGLTIAMIPWMCQENETEILTFLKKTKAKVVGGHWDIIGFEMQKGMVNRDHGLAADVFKKFKLVLSGHYHSPSKIGNIQYLGSPFQLTWGDYGDKRGFYILDTVTLKLEFVENPFTTFQKVFYDDQKYEPEQILEQDFSVLAGKIVKVVVRKKGNTFCFEKFLESVHKAGPVDVSVIDEVFDVELEYQEEDGDVGKSTIALIEEYVEAASGVNQNVKLYKDELLKMVRALYLEAVEVNQTVDA